MNGREPDFEDSPKFKLKVFGLKHLYARKFHTTFLRLQCEEHSNDQTKQFPKLC